MLLDRPRHTTTREASKNVWLGEGSFPPMQANDATIDGARSAVEETGDVLISHVTVVLCT
jgi:hypothetical protein